VTGTAGVGLVQIGIVDVVVLEDDDVVLLSAARVVLDRSAASDDESQAGKSAMTAVHATRTAQPRDDLIGSMYGPGPCHPTRHQFVYSKSQ
jgi:hypothetical protein